MLDPLTVKPYGGKVLVYHEEMQKVVTYYKEEEGEDTCIQIRYEFDMKGKLSGVFVYGGYNPEHIRQLRSM